MLRTIAMKMTAGSLMLAVGLAAPATAAAQTSSQAATQAQTSVLSPWVALSALGSSSSSAALCASSAAASASSSAQTAAPGCVLPVMDTPPAPVAQTVEPMPAAVAPAAAGGFNLIPLLVGLASAAVFAAVLLSSDDGDDIIRLPPEPITQP